MLQKPRSNVQWALQPGRRHSWSTFSHAAQPQVRGIPCCISELAHVTKCPDNGSRFNFNCQMLRPSSVYCISETASLGSLHSEASFWTTIELMSPARHVDIRLLTVVCLEPMWRFLKAGVIEGDSDYEVPPNS